MAVFLDTASWALVAGASFALIILVSAAGSLFQPLIRPSANPAAGKFILGLMLLLCLLLAFSLVPLMVGTVLGFQEVIGNRDVPAIGFALDNQDAIVIAFWLVFAAGSLIAIPAMLHDMKP
ncbi:MAG TPA: hypothetical protein VLD37_02235 [Candidatus Bilamarchaeum sp.]|nr:hypothetical protein [Candidatus Bilamarchaeum sp.]